MVILHTETLKHWGGQQNRILIEAAGLNKMGHRVIIACRRGSVLALKAKEAGITVYELNMVKQAHLSNVPKLMRIIKNEGVDIVATHSSVDSWAGGMAAKLSGRRLIRFRHNLYPIGRDPLTRFIYAIPDKLIAISNTVRDTMTGYGLKRERIRVIPDAVDIKRFSPKTDGLRQELNIPPETIVIGNTSSFTKVKGQESLLQAFNILHEKQGQTPYALLFAVRLNEPMKSRFLSLVKEDLRSRVIFLGHRDDIPSVLKTIDIFVFPSMVEGLGTSLIEAMAMERPAAVSDISTFRDFIKDGVNGLFFRTGDPEDIAEKISYINGNVPLKTELGKNARTTVLERFTLDSMLDNTLTSYKEALNGR
ncbi:MAG: glycosyltransferase family 4 protein [Nitrospirota bacterium]|nr:glycosyltransferase family 4 protein [Nitrospirota bacterium]